MPIHIEIPEAVAGSIRLPPPEVEKRLLAELSAALYAQEILSFGKAAELANLSRYAFADFVAERNIPRHYSEEDLAQDLQSGGGQ